MERQRYLWLQQAALRGLPLLPDSGPMVVLEAVAAAKFGGRPDLIEPVETGLLFDPADHDRIGTAVAKLPANRDHAPGLATAAQMRARERFHPQTIARRHLEIYGEIAPSRRKAAPTPTHEVG